MLTVKDLLHIKSLEGIKIIAGHQGINNEISIVNIMENPDSFDWLTSNELLLSTGYIFKGNEELQNKIIKELSEINCAGLCIKMKRYFDKIPQNMIDHANKYGLPLLELPFGYSLSRIITIINEKATAEYDSLNRRSLDMHNVLFRIALEGGGIDQISSELSKTINNPVIILDRDWNLLYYTDREGNHPPLKSCFQLVKNRPVFPIEFSETIPKNISEIKKSIKRIYYGEDKEIKCRIMPVAVANYVYGYIVVWQTIRELVEFDYIALEQAATIMALERIKAREIEEVKLKIRQDFFDDLLTGKITSMDTIQNLCDLHGLKSDYTYYCIVINIQPVEPQSYEDMVVRKYELDHTAKKCMDLVHDLAGKADGEITCFYRNNRIIVLVGKNENKPSIAVSEAKAFANELHEELTKKIKKTTFLIGIGRQYKMIASLHKSFSEAHEAMRLMHRFDDKREVSHFEDYSVYHFLDSNIKPSEMEDFFQKCLGSIYQHDLSYGTSFMNTLENYFIHNRNVSEAAKAMFIHRNTFIYRIDKIKEMLNSELKNSEELLQIQLALKLFRLLNKM
ncbi:PucR family transcriptional regulator [Brevibacillus sp. SYSU BS000544]|uniref:PucR family transcriptional regulator n=1 Tax=Brevibacillus sp. SYSU BS000544 TaxID=3416443 RepID=UPI003CE5731E